MLTLDPPEADVVESLIVNTVGLVRVLHQLMDRQGGVVRLHHGVGHLQRPDITSEQSNGDLISQHN